MPRKPQFGSIYQPVKSGGVKTAVWWIRYYVDGVQQYESSKSKRYTDAEKLLRERLAEIETGQYAGPTIFSFRQPHSASTESQVPLQSQKRWSKPATTTLPGDYRITEEPDDSRVMAKLTAYATRVSSLLPERGVLHVLVVPFSVLAPAGDGRKLGAACILIDTLAELSDPLLQGIYTKAQLFWLRYWLPLRIV